MYKGQLSVRVVKIHRSAHTQHSTCQGIWLREEDDTTTKGEDQRSLTYATNAKQPYTLSQLISLITQASQNQ